MGTKLTKSRNAPTGLLLAIPSPCLALVTDRSLCTTMPLEEKVERAIAGGVSMVQLREKGLGAKELFGLAVRLREITFGKSIFVVNDQVDVALACGADGVQMGEESLSVEAVRRTAGHKLLIGRSVHSVEGALEAEGAGADFLVVGAIFPSRTHPGVAPAGIELLQQVKDSIRIPFFAIGGIDSSNAGSAIRAGAWGVALISAILGSPEPEDAARKILAAIENEWSSLGRKGVKAQR